MTKRIFVCVIVFVYDCEAPGAQAQSARRHHAGGREATLLPQGHHRTQLPVRTQYFQVPEALSLSLSCGGWFGVVVRTQLFQVPEALSLSLVVQRHVDWWWLLGVRSVG